MRHDPRRSPRRLHRRPDGRCARGGVLAHLDHLQEDLGLDSMDFLNLVSALLRRFGLPIPESDYPRLATPAKAVGYLVEMLAR